MRRMISVLLLLGVFTAVSAQPRIRSEMSEPRSAAELTRQLSLQAPAGEPMQISVSLQVQFEFGSARLTPAGRHVLDLVAQAIQEPVLVHELFLIEGHTDSIGEDYTNLALSQARAKAAASYLVSRGISAARLNTAGYGELRPIPGTHGEDPRNRRVEIVRLP